MTSRLANDQSQGSASVTNELRFFFFLVGYDGRNRERLGNAEKMTMLVKRHC